MILAKRLKRFLFSELTCDATPQAPQNGFVHCSDGSQLGSFCFYGCEQGYKLEGNDHSSCVKTDKYFAQWDFKAPTCVPQGKYHLDCRKTIINFKHCLMFECFFKTFLSSEHCHETKKADVVIAIDSSLEFGLYHFETAKDFTFDFIK